MSIVTQTAVFMEIFFYMVTMLVQTFIPCYYGSEVTAASEKLSESVFHSDWTDQDKKFKFAMKLFMEKAKHYKKISIFGVYDVNLETFRVICKSAYSLYAVFTTMGSK